MASTINKTLCESVLHVQVIMSSRSFRYCPLWTVPKTLWTLLCMLHESVVGVDVTWRRDIRGDLWLGHYWLHISFSSLVCMLFWDPLRWPLLYISWCWLEYHIESNTPFTMLPPIQLLTRTNAPPIYIPCTMHLSTINHIYMLCTSWRAKFIC